MRSARPLASAVRRLSLALAVVTIVTGCGVQWRSSGDEHIVGARIRFAISLQPDEARAVSELVKRFEARTKTGVSLELFTRFRGGAAVTVEPVTSGGMKHLLRNERSNIHLYAQDNGDLVDLVSEGLAQDVSDIRIPTEVLDQMVPRPVADGTIRFVPFRPNVRLTYASREAMAGAGVRPPATVDEIEDVARKLRSLDRNTGDLHPRVTLSLSRADSGAPTAVTISELVLSSGGDPRRLDRPGFLKAFELLQRLFKERLLARESLVAKHDTEIEYLKQGAVVLAQNWSVTSARLEQAGKLGDFEVHEGWQRRHVVGGDVLGIPGGVSGKERAAAVALAEFLMSREAQAFLVKRNAWPAIRDDAYDLAGLTDTVTAARNALRNGWYRPTEPYWAAVSQAMNEAVDRIVFGDEAPGAVLDELHRRVAEKNLDYPPPE